MRRNTYKKYYTWDANIAYLAGLFASDGCLANNGRHLIMTSKDIEIISSVAAITQNRAKPRLKTGQFGTQAYHFQFGDVALYDFLLNAGITPAKSKTIKRVAVPEYYYRDFLRGYFDGDGTVYGYKDLRWKNSFMYYSGFVSASYEFLLWLQASNRSQLGTSSGKIKPNNRAYTLTYAKADSQIIFKAIYQPHTTYFLSRKYEKFKQFISNDPYAKITVNARVL